MTRSDRMSFLNMIALPTKDNPRYDKILKSLDRHIKQMNIEKISLLDKKKLLLF